MSTHWRFMSWLLVVAAAVSLMPAVGAQELSEPVRSLVVDRSSNILWLGLPGPVKQGAVFDIMLLPSGRVIARASVIECTPDAPYVAKARFVLEEAGALIPIGAYAEAGREVLAGNPHEVAGYREARLGPKGVAPLSLSVGCFYPTESALRDETQDIWPAVRLSYRLCRSERACVSLCLGYYHGDGRFGSGLLSGTRDLRVVPLTVDVKVYGSGKSGCGFYGLAGAGAYYVHDERTIGTVEDELKVVTFGWRAGIGYESGSGRFAEVAFTDASRSDFKGVEFNLGARF